MAEPLARIEGVGEGVLADAAQRLERALKALEAALGRTASTPTAASTSSAQIVELDAARRRGRELETAAADASQALGRAMAEVQRVLQDDDAGMQDPQISLFDRGLLDQGVVDLPLESGPGLPDDEYPAASESAADKEPTA